MIILNSKLCLERNNPIVSPRRWLVLILRLSTKDVSILFILRKTLSFLILCSGFIEDKQILMECR